MTKHFVIRPADKVFTFDKEKHRMIAQIGNREPTKLNRYVVGLHDSTEFYLVMGTREADNLFYTGSIGLTGGEIVASMQPGGLKTQNGNSTYVFEYDQSHLEEDKASMEDIFPYGFELKKEGEENDSEQH